MEDSLRKKIERRLTQLKNERNSWEPDWRELSENFLPRRGRFQLDDANNGTRRNSNILNDTTTLAANTLASGMMSGITSPARPWFRLTTPDPDMMEFGPVKNWLYDVERAMSELFLKSNLYNVLPTVYLEMGVFGQCPMAMMPDPRELVRFYPFTCGSYMLDNSARLQVDTLYREFRMTVRQLIQQFGEENVSDNVKTLYSNGNVEQWIDVVHAIEPNDDRSFQRLDNKNMAYRSVYMEKACTGDKTLRVSGFNQFPVMAPRWDVTGEDIYGTSPGLMALGDAKALQKMENRKLKLVDLGTDPPRALDSSLRGKKSSMLPGGVTYIDNMNQGVVGARPIYEPNPNWFTALRNEIVATEQRIDAAFFRDLFLMVSQIERSNVTATEIAARQQEKMLMLGPVLERLNDELLDPLIDMAFQRMLEQSVPIWMGMMPGAPMIPPPPEELTGVDLRVEYISVLAQAQKAVGVTAIERVVGFAGNLANVTQNPQVLDKLDTDQAIDEYATMLGVPPTLIRSDEDVAGIREQRAQSQQQQIAAEQLGSIIQGAKTLSETDVSSDNALTAITGTY